jgi:cysteine desulfurase
VPGIVGFGAACDIAREDGSQEAERLRGLRDHLRDRLCGELDDVQANGAAEPRLTHNLNLSFWPVEAETLLLALRSDVALSSGSACTTATLEPSYVLKAIGVGHELAHCSIRFGLGRSTTKEQVDRAADRIIEVVREQRAKSPLWAAKRKREEAS